MAFINAGEGNFGQKILFRAVSMLRRRVSEGKLSWLLHYRKKTGRQEVLDPQTHGLAFELLEENMLSEHR